MIKEILFCIGVTELCSEDLEMEGLLKEFQDVTQKLDEVLKDLEWRKPDVEAEEAKLKYLLNRAKKDPGVDVATQAVVVRVLRGVLNDKIAEADRLEKRMNELTAALEARQAPAATPEEVKESGKALHKKKKHLG